jgi:cytochrome P450/NADPH-cytochrome P450 reductase
MERLAEEFGPIFRLETPKQRLIVVSSPKLAEEVCDDRRFDKHVHNVLRQIRAFAGNGLFTVNTTEKSWKAAHRTMSPSLSAKAMPDYFGPISEIAGQLAQKWENSGPHQPISVCEDMTRFAFDSVALSTLNHRFDSFQRKEFHPFVQAMGENLREAWMRARRPAVINAIRFPANLRFAKNTAEMRRQARQILQQRRETLHDGPPTDLVGHLLASNESVLDEENLIDQIITLLIAGHDTTGSLLAFALHALLSHPEELAKAVAEVDSVVGQEALQPEHLPRLNFLDSVLREALRLWPSAPTFARKSKVGETWIGGDFSIRASDVVLVLLPKLHRSKEVWGSDAEQFRPSRMERARLTKSHLTAYKPFGTGQRACIGASFALRESVILLATLLQKFSLRMAESSRGLKIRETPALRPEEFQIYASSRKERNVGDHEPEKN